MVHSGSVTTFSYLHMLYKISLDSITRLMLVENISMNIFDL